MIRISTQADGCIVPVRAQPGARRNGIVGEYNGAVKIAVSARPDKGKANDAIQEVLCEALTVGRSQVAITSGHTSRDKKFLIRGIAAKFLEQKLASFLERA